MMKTVIAAFLAIVLGFVALIGYDLAVDNGELVARLERMF